ncbi:ABC transporter permease [Halorussus litoreus]|uniref:ABC transporter permease n=1 Tax=Halorussus litoreus TaxID=1710536 RepID=UPI000E22F31C|nr:ABC transporter permease [Halorussus litoreus]
MSGIGPTADELADRDGRRVGFATRDRIFLAVLAALAAVFAVDWFGVYQADAHLLDSQLRGLDWLFLYALAVVAFYVVAPLAADRERALGYWRQIRESRWATASVGVLVVWLLFAIVGPEVLDPGEPLYGSPGRGGVMIGQPPIGFSVVETAVHDCAGRMANGRCHGTWHYPFGTSMAGEDVMAMTAIGARVAFQIATITVAIIVPLATVVGTIAATYGGKVDEFLMRYVDVQQSIPAFFVIILSQEAISYVTQGWGGSLLLIVVVFGLMSWGGVARIVRAEALEITQRDYVRAAKSAGASRFDVVRTHVVPNALPAVLTAVTVQIGWLILLEATLAYLGFFPADYQTWGYVMKTNMGGAYPTTNWWAVLYPAAFLGLVVVSVQVLGDALRDVTDPRAE